MSSSFSKEDIENIVRESNSIKECLQKMERPCGAGNYRTFYRLQRLYDLDTSHFVQTKDKNEGVYIPLSEYKNKQTCIKGSVLIKKLVNEGYKEYRCEKCGITEWNGEKIALQVHHIDGDHYNNDIDNLMVLCPNCHSQTDSFCGRGVKKKKKEKTCKECGNVISKRNKSGICAKCKRKKGKKTARVEKEWLLNELKNEHGNFSLVGRKLSVSDNAIRKWCRKYGLSDKSSDYKNGSIA